MNDNGAMQWLEEHGDMLYAFALRRLGDAHMAEEAVQNTLLAALENVKSFNARSGVRTWLTGILKFKIIDILRERQQWHEPLGRDELEYGVSEDDLFAEDGHWAQAPVEWLDPARLLDQKQIRALIDACIARLPRRMAQLFWLREMQEESAEQVCHSLGISGANLYQMLFRARQTLRVCLTEGGRDGSVS